MKTIVILIVIAATPDTCSFLQVDTATHSEIKVDSIEECEEQATVLNAADKQLAFCIEEWV